MLPSSLFGDGGAHVFGASDLAVFLLANAIICAICGPKVWAEFRASRAPRGSGDATPDRPRSA
jgi:hypothetical protein